MFNVLSITIPLVSTVLYDATIPIEATATIFNAFYGTSTSSNETNQTLDNTYDATNLAIQSPIYCLVNTYFPRSIVCSMKIVEKILFILIYSNVIEAILYARKMAISKRYYSRLILSLRNVKIKVQYHNVMSLFKNILCTEIPMKNISIEH